MDDDFELPADHGVAVDWSDKQLLSAVTEQLAKLNDRGGSLTLAKAAVAKLKDLLAKCVLNPNE